MRGSLISLIYDKLLKLNLSVASDSQAITLINADIERIDTGMQQVHEIWANAIQIAFALWILYSQIGAAFTAPLIICISTSPIATTPFLANTEQSVLSLPHFLAKVLVRNKRRGWSASRSG